MGKLNVFSIFLNSLNTASTFPFNISSYISLNHVSDRTKSILFKKIFNFMVLFRNDPKNSFSFFSINKIAFRLSFSNHYPFRFQFLEFNCSKTTLHKLKVEFYSEVKRTVNFCGVIL